MKHMVLVWILVLGMAFPASAAVKQFKQFSADVPAGWTAQETKDGSVDFTAPGKQAVLNVTRAKTGGTPDETLVRNLAAQRGGTDPEAMDDGYVFEYTRNGVKNLCFFSVEDGFFTLLTMTDPQDAFSEQFSAILGSLKDR